MSELRYLVENLHPLSEPSRNYSVLEAYDTLHLTRCSEIYLEALEHYILMNVTLSWDTQQEITSLLKLYRAESKAGLDRTAHILEGVLKGCYD